MAREHVIGWVQIYNLFSSQCYLPYSVGLLQASARAHLRHPERYHFLEPLFDRVPIQENLERLLTADLVFFSVYVWNFRYSLELARQLKALQPGLFIVFGGPHVPHQSEAFLRSHPHVDLVCHKEGEAVAVSLLEQLPSRRWLEVPSVSFVDGAGVFVQTPTQPRVREPDRFPSPYLSGTFDPLLEAHPQRPWLMLLETNRGCPYGCTFCDWGSATQSKLYTFSLERIFGELEWAGQRQIDYIFCCDANFGILPRDEHIARFAGEVKRRYGFPRVLSLQSAKGNSEQLARTWDAVLEAGLNEEVALPLQSMDEQTLRAVKRINLPRERFRELNQRFARQKVRTYTDVILGLPGESYDAFAESLGAIIEHGQHHRLQLSNLTVLPNAELADPDYRQTWGIKSVHCRIVSAHAQLQGSLEVPEMQELVTETAAMPAADWTRARALAWASVVYHCHKPLQIPLLLVYHLTGIPFRRLLEALLSDGVQGWPTLNRVKKTLLEAAARVQSGEPEFMSDPRLPGVLLPADDLVFTLLVVDGQLPMLYREVGEWLESLLAELAPGLDLEVTRAGLALNAAMMGTNQPSSSLELPYNVWPFFEGVRTGEDIELQRGRYVHHLRAHPDFYRRVESVEEAVGPDGDSDSRHGRDHWPSSADPDVP